MTEAVSKVIPILIMMLLGVISRKKKWLSEDTIKNTKKGIVHVALPAVLFTTFMKMAINQNYIVISVLFFLLLILLLLLGFLLNKIKGLSHVGLPYLMTGFAFGLLGIPLFGGVYGMNNVGGLSILGVGHEFFAWFVYFTVIKHKMGQEKFGVKTVIDFIKSPLIISIVLGIFVNVTGITSYLEAFFLTKGFILTMTMLAGITTPLILIIVGYEIHFDVHFMKKSFQLLCLRLGMVLFFGYMLKILVIDSFFYVDTLFDMSYFTFLILPPPFALVLFMSQYESKENVAVVNNTIVLNTLFAITAFSIAVVFKNFS